MITVKHILEQYSLVSDKATEEELKLSALSDAGIFESSKLPMIRRSLKKNINEMTEAERKTLKSLLESLIDHTLLNEKSMSYPSDKDMPTVIILQRKAIRVFPDNQKIGLYYSQSLNRYISIPFGPNIKDLSPQLNEESFAERKAREKEEKKEQQKVSGRRIVPLISKQREKQFPAAKLTTSVPSVGNRKNVNIGQKPAMPWGDREVIKITPEMRQQAGQEYINKQQTLSGKVGALIGAKLAMAAERTPLRSKTTTITGKPLKESFRNNLNQIREKREYRTADAALDAASFLPGPAGTAASLASAGMSLSRGDYTGAALDVAGALPGVGYLAKGAKVARIATKTGKAADAIKAARIEKAKDPAKLKARYERRFGTKTQRIARGAGKVAKGAGKLAAGAAGLGAAVLGGLAGGDEKIKDTSSRQFDFSGPGRAQASTSGPQTQRATASAAEREYWRQQSRSGIYGGSSSGIQETKILQLKNIVDQNISNHTLQIDEETITINKSVAKKIVKLHESLNRTNQKKLEKMLNEDVVSFRKVINFALKQ